MRAIKTLQWKTMEVLKYIAYPKIKNSDLYIPFKIVKKVVKKLQRSDNKNAIPIISHSVVSSQKEI